MLASYFDDMKNFVRSTVKGSETNLRKEFKKGINDAVTPLKTSIKQLQVAVLENRKEIRRVETELRKEIQGVRTELKEEIKGESESIRSELKKEMTNMEERLIRLDDHESRIATLEEIR